MLNNLETVGIKQQYRGKIENHVIQYFAQN